MNRLPSTPAASRSGFPRNWAGDPATDDEIAEYQAYRRRYHEGVRLACEARDRRKHLLQRILHFVAKLSGWRWVGVARGHLKSVKGQQRVGRLTDDNGGQADHDALQGREHRQGAWWAAGVQRLFKHPNSPLWFARKESRESPGAGKGSPDPASGDESGAKGGAS